MSALDHAESIFFRTLDKARAQRLVSEALFGCDDGEAYFEYRRDQSMLFENGVVRSADDDVIAGFGLRGVCGETIGYAHASELSEAALQRAADHVSATRHFYEGHYADPPNPTNRLLYDDIEPLEALPVAKRVAWLQEIDAYARAQDKRIIQVSASLSSSRQLVMIMRADGQSMADARPLARLNVTVTMADGSRREVGHWGEGGRRAIAEWLDEARWKRMVDEAVRQASLNMESVAAPAGELPVVLGAGWAGILLHEAVGHGLEGDFNRKKTSLYAGKIGEPIAAPGVTVIDDGTFEQRRGSLSIDDEGTPSARNVLIENGVLRSYMQDRQNARLSGLAPTGNGRRESFMHAPMPRMTNTFMENGACTREDIINSVTRGVYAVHFGGGQVDITNGNFVFSCTEAYLIENGKVTAPLKGATLIGNGPDAMRKVSMVGNDFELDSGIGTCGKDGQAVPVGVGQPTLKIDAMTVGGANLA